MATSNIRILAVDCLSETWDNGVSQRNSNDSRFGANRILNPRGRIQRAGNPVHVDTRTSPYVGLKWPVVGSKGDKYTVEMLPHGFICNCMSYQVRKRCKHTVAIDELVGGDHDDPIYNTKFAQLSWSKAGIPKILNAGPNPVANAITKEDMMDIEEMTDKDIKAYLNHRQDKATRIGIWPKTRTVYLHRDKGANYSLAEELGLDEEATQTLRHMGYEIALTVNVSQDGSAVATHFDHHQLPVAVEMT